MSDDRPIAPSVWSDRAFLLGLSILGGSYVVLILALLTADLFFTSRGDLLEALAKPEIRYAIKLSVISCTVTAVLAMWVAVPLGYLLARTRFPGREVVDTILDIPIVLPPLVIGLSLLILFQMAPGKAIEEVTRRHIGTVFVYVLLPLILAVPLTALMTRTLLGRLAATPVVAVSLAGILSFTVGPDWAGFVQQRLHTRITYAIPSVIIAQFAVATAFAVRTMRITFEQIPARTEHVALTLGCTRAQAFWLITLPQARRGMLTAATLAWARSLGEFGPILIFSGATRLKTEVLSTSVFLELSIGNLNAAIAVSILMVIVAVCVLVLMRLFGLRGTGLV